MAARLARAAGVSDAAVSQTLAALERMGLVAPPRRRGPPAAAGRGDRGRPRRARGGAPRPARPAGRAARAAPAAASSAAASVRSAQMRIAMLAPAWFAVPPVRYGGVEWVVSILA